MLNVASEPTARALPISAVVLTYNEEQNIETCLQSVAGWCQEIFVVDSGSTDRTQDICRQYASVYEHPFTDSASQWEWTLKNLPLSCEWVMPLDADHVITPGLKQHLQEKLVLEDETVDGYYTRHQYFFRGVPMRGFKPYSLRLFRHHRTRVDHSELVDFRFVVKGKTKKLAGTVYEINKKEDAIDFWIDKHQRFSSRVAIEEVLRMSGALDWSFSPRLFGNPDERVTWLKSRWYRLPLYVRPFLYFFYRYVLRLGFLDGKAGFVYHFLHAFWFRLLVDIKIATLREQLGQGKLSIEQLEASFAHEFSV